ncbi:hypothetical protein BJ546DRAFT_999158 [Cryomyces antarcticus]
MLGRRLRCSGSCICGRSAFSITFPITVLILALGESVVHCIHVLCCSWHRDSMKLSLRREWVLVLAKREKNCVRCDETIPNEMRRRVEGRAGGAGNDGVL